MVQKSRTFFFYFFLQATFLHPFRYSAGGHEVLLAECVKYRYQVCEREVLVYIYVVGFLYGERVSWLHLPKLGQKQALIA